MIEVTFTESAGGGLMCARQCAPVFTDSVVYCVPLGLSMGDISTDVCGPERRAFLQSLICTNNADFAYVAEEELSGARKSLEQIIRAAVNGEPIRLWYSDIPDEMCGFYHILSILPAGSHIRTVKLPEYTEEGNTISIHSGWGGILPRKFADFLKYDEKLSENAHRMYRSRWKQLVQENAPLRAVVNGSVISAGEELYDFYILRELDAREDVFHEAYLIGDILGKYQLGISDWLIHRRIRHYEAQGLLEPVDQAPDDGPGYRRYLRKRTK